MKLANFYYFYECLFIDIHVQFLLHEFQMGVLHLLNVAPTQLHPNSWTSLQAFRIVCKYLSLTPTLKVSLHFYSFRSDKRSGWLSLISRSKACLISPFTSSYKIFKRGFKNYKGEFFKIIIEETRKNISMVEMFQSLFFISHLKFNFWLHHSMKPEDLQVLLVLDHLSQKLPTRGLLQIYVSPRPKKRLYGYAVALILLFL